MKVIFTKRYRAALVVLALLAAVVAVAPACNTSAPPGHADSYRLALQQYPAEHSGNQLLGKFIAVYGDLKSPALAGAIDSAYAPKLYFNDTFNIFTSRQALKAYLLTTAERLDSSRVQIEDIARSENELYLRWRMTLELEVMGKKISSDSVGVTHLRFNRAGQIVVHQDYWDGIEGFYRHLPYVGRWLGKLRERL